ncbi:Beta-lactamase/transpeptidase-like [Quillaja saponaria]|uniref:Beta-lactamase/transpeptidase-like n=1 Tax=Quillaja saponaria TaxID=32244 RepID=A0AAD7PSN5_QUISA|nr:Beta-lactamase/transpeptidase-like [Quillaja saponaria]
MWALLSLLPCYMNSLGVESRLATLTVDTDDLNKLSGVTCRPDLPSTFQSENISQLVTTLPILFNTPNTRRVIIPAANGHCSAHALARYYAALADGGRIPPSHSSNSKLQLGSHHHTPKFYSRKASKKRKGGKGKDLFKSSIMRTNDDDKNYNYRKDFKDGTHNRDTSSDSLTRLANDSSSSGGSSGQIMADNIIDIDPRSNFSGQDI